MRDLNKIILIGRLGNDPVQRETRSGIPVANFSIATSRKRKQDAGSADGQMGLGSRGDDRPAEETVWHRVVVWGKSAETCARYLKKGQSVFVEGSIRTRKYVDKEGVSRFASEVHADEVGFLGGGRLVKRPESEDELVVEATETF
jgi:single-strand DNA-binding protein